MMADDFILVIFRFVADMRISCGVNSIAKSSRGACVVSS